MSAQKNPPQKASGNGMIPRPPALLSGGEKEALGLPVGWRTSGCSRRRIGFSQGNDTQSSVVPELIRYAGDGHLMTLASTGSGKGRGVLIPALLSHPGSTLTIDLKGEAYNVAARYRREMGHTVVAIDPFHYLLSKPDTLNPMDLSSMPGAEPDVDAELLAELLGGGVCLTSHDQFWERNGKAMLVGVIGLTAEDENKDKRNIGQVLDYMYADDVDYSLASKLDTHKFTNNLARQELCAYLQHEGDRCRPSVRSTAQCIVKCLGSESVRKSLANTSFDLMEWYNGNAIDIFLIFPPDKLESHRALQRLMFGTLLTILTRRQEMPEQRTLLLLDEIGQLGHLAHLKAALTLLRGYGVQVWSLWQDLGQLKAIYPTEWETIINNSAVIQAFGLTNGLAARPIAEVMDLTADELLRMTRSQQALLLPGQGPQITRRVDYLTDPQFAGRFDLNPRYRNRKGLLG